MNLSDGFLEFQNRFSLYSEAEKRLNMFFRFLTELAALRPSSAISSLVMKPSCWAVRVLRDSLSVLGAFRCNDDTNIPQGHLSRWKCRRFEPRNPE
jgi:hypothetical protein